MGRCTSLAFVLICLLFSSAAADIWFVKPDGTGDVPTIQAGVDTVAPGDTIVLASGVFTGDGNINIVVPPKMFLMKSVTGQPEDCIIDCEGHLGWGRRGFEFEQATYGPTIRGITIRNGNAMGTGGAVYCEGSPTFRECVFESNYSDYKGGAVTCYSSYAFPVFKKCAFVSNDVGVYGGAMYIEGIVLEVTVDSCTFYENNAPRGGAIYCYAHEATAWIGNSVFHGNSASLSGGAVEVAIMGADIRNCTFFANSAPEGSGIASGTSGGPGCPSAHVNRCIIAFGVGGSGYYQYYYYPETYPMRCTDIYGNEGGDWVDGLADRLGVDGNISACPSFCLADVEPYDFRLCDGSPCLPGNHPDGYDCGLIGALGEGCVCGPTSSKPSTWGAIKALYR